MRRTFPSEYPSERAMRHLHAVPEPIGQELDVVAALLLVFLVSIPLFGGILLLAWSFE